MHSSLFDEVWLLRTRLIDRSFDPTSWLDVHWFRNGWEFQIDEVFNARLINRLCLLVRVV